MTTKAIVEGVNVKKESDVVSELIDGAYKEELKAVLNRDIDVSARIDTLRNELLSLQTIIEKYVTSGMNFSRTCRDVNNDIVDILLLDGLTKEDIVYFADKEYNLKDNIKQIDGYQYLKEFEVISNKINEATFLGTHLLFELIALNMSYIMTQKGLFKVQ